MKIEILVAWAVLFLAACGSTPQPHTQATAKPIPAATALTVGRSIPYHLTITTIGVSAPVVQVGVDKTNHMDSPTNGQDVAWYSLGAAPGEHGDAVFAGHLDQRGQPCTVFCRLHELHNGSQIMVSSTGGVTVWTVYSTEQVPADAAPAGLFATTGDPAITLVTCVNGPGEWDMSKQMYKHRLLVSAHNPVTLKGQ
jgi:LPXTG-site transpeptidase (sortase) family protein